MKKVWHGMRLMSGYSNGSSKSSPSPRTSLEFANELNAFYNRFDCHDLSQQTNDLLTSLTNDNETFLTVSEEDVRKELSKLNPSKASGPDGITPRVLKSCADQLSHIFALIFNFSFERKYVPKLWKLSGIIPVPKKPTITCNNDLRPIALTSVVMKSAEKFVLKQLKAITAQHMDPLQFAYRAKRCPEDAILFMLEKLYSHLEKSYCGHYARIIYFDFSSAFNTIQPLVLGHKLQKMDVPNNLTGWIINYLTNRSQFVHIRPSNIKSKTLTSNTGAPQGTVLAPFLFTIYTSDIRASDSNCYMVKFADDTALIGLLKNDNIVAYNKQINNFATYCKDNYLQLNVTKTKELVIDYRRNQTAHNPIRINENEVQQTRTYKYFGIVIDDRLQWHDHVEHLCKKLNSRLYCLRKMHKFKIDQHVLQLFYNAVIGSVWGYCLSSWRRNALGSDVKLISSVIKQANRIIGDPQNRFEKAYESASHKSYKKIIADPTHPLFPIFSAAVSSRSNRMLLPPAKTNRHKLSFVPQAMRLHNKNFKR